MDSNNLGETIRRQRLAKGMSQAELAKAIGISEISVRKYEHGERKPKFESLMRLDQILDLGLGFIQTDKIDQENLNAFSCSNTACTYLTVLPKIKEILESKDFSLIPQREADILAHEIDEYLAEANNLSDPDDIWNFFKDKDILISHKFFNAIMEPYESQCILDITDALTGYLSLNFSGKKFMLDYFQAFYNNQNFIQKEYSPSERRPSEGQYFTVEL